MINEFSRQAHALFEGASASVAKVTGRGKVGRPSKKVNPKTAAVRKLQGQYLGALNGLNQTSRAKVKKIAKDKGVAAALKVALSLKK